MIHHKAKNVYSVRTALTLSLIHIYCLTYFNCNYRCITLDKIDLERFVKWLVLYAQNTHFLLCDELFHLILNLTASLIGLSQLIKCLTGDLINLFFFEIVLTLKSHLSY